MRAEHSANVWKCASRATTTTSKILSICKIRQFLPAEIGLASFTSQFRRHRIWHIINRNGFTFFLHLIKKNIHRNAAPFTTFKFYIRFSNLMWECMYFNFADFLSPKRFSHSVHIRSDFWNIISVVCKEDLPEMWVLKYFRLLFLICQRLSMFLVFCAARFFCVIHFIQSIFICNFAFFYSHCSEINGNPVNAEISNKFNCEANIRM